VADQYARAVRVPDYDVSSRKSGDQGGSAKANEVAAPTKQQQRDAVFAAVSRWTAHGLGPFHTDHLGTQVGQHHGGERAGANSGDLDDAVTVEGSRHG
jgi:hypothetical protein